MPTKEVSFQSACDDTDFKASLRVAENLGTRPGNWSCQILAHIFSNHHDLGSTLFLAIFQKMDLQKPKFHLYLVAGWTNPFEKYARQIGNHLPNLRGEHKKIFELPPPSILFFSVSSLFIASKRFQKHAGWGDDHRLICNDLHSRHSCMDGWGSILHGCNATCYLYLGGFPPKMDGNKDGWFRGENQKPHYFGKHPYLALRILYHLLRMMSWNLSNTLLRRWLYTSITLGLGVFLLPVTEANEGL